MATHLTGMVAPHRPRSAARVVLVTAGVAAACVVLTTPRLRRLAFRAGRWWLGSSLPLVIAAAVGRAWQASAPGVTRDASSSR